MWKVKRMNTARIVVLTIAVSAGGIAVYPASGSGNRPAPATPLQAAAALGLAQTEIGLGQPVRPGQLRWQPSLAATASNRSTRRDERPDATTGIAGINAVETISDDQALERGVNIIVVRYGVPISTIQKGPKGRSI
jgi:pilus assembly protein CpaB